VTLRTIAEIGKTREHLRLTVEDENGTAQNILWWGGAGEELADPASPLMAGSKFDIAYTLRASSFRGQKQVALQFQEIRIVEEKPVEVRGPELETSDWRLELDRLNSLNQEVLIWAEGADRSKGKSRFELHPAEEFAIYSTPPSPADLRAALDRVKPKKIYVFAVSPLAGSSPSTPRITDEFLTRLSGMAKYAINNRGGRVSIQELASATAQRERAIRIGLEWLAAGGHVAVTGDADAGAVRLSAGTGELNQYLQKELYIAAKGILEETAAYRQYFSRANLESIIESALV
jgi:hypothetical protein